MIHFFTVFVNFYYLKSARFTCFYMLYLVHKRGDTMTYEDIKDLFDNEENEEYDWLMILLLIIRFWDKYKTININIGGK